MNEMDQTEIESAVRTTLLHAVHVIRELGPSMSPGALAACIERNIDEQTAVLIQRLAKAHS